MASKTMSCSQLLLAMTMFLFAIYAKGSAAASPFCEKCTPAQAAQCDELVKGATTWEGALTSVIDAIFVEARKAKPMVDNLPSDKESLKSTCKAEVESINDNLRKVVDQIKNGDAKKSIPTELSAILSYFSDCTDALEEFEVEVPELTHFAEAVRNYTSISLAVTKLKYNFT